MKIRSGFVSNSSSSSFLIPINALSENQLLMIQNLIDKINFEGWAIIINEKCIYGYTFMDNFDMHFFLNEEIKVKSQHIYWAGDEGFEDIFSGNNNNLDLEKINKDIIKEERKDKLNELENLQIKIN